MSGFGWWVTEYLRIGGPVFLTAWVFWIIFSITLHELAHGWTAIWRGDRTPAELGHITYNPLVHMGMTSLIVFAVTGYTWGSMPVDESRMRGRHAAAIVAAAGPAMNLLLALAAAVLYAAWLGVAPRAQISGNLQDSFSVLFRVGIVVNVALAILNLAPFFPLDGGRVAAHYWRAYADFLRTEHGPLVAFGGIVVLFAVGGEYIFAAAIWTLDRVDWMIDSIPGLVPPLVP